MMQVCNKWEVGLSSFMKIFTCSLIFIQLFCFSKEWLFICIQMVHDEQKKKDLDGVFFLMKTFIKFHEIVR